MDSFKFFTENYTKLIKGVPFIENESIPWAPLEKPLNECKVVLVTTSGVHPESQTPFDVESKKGDWTYREIPKELRCSELMVTHTHYDHTDADRDINCVFPLDRLKELEQEGVIGSIADIHYGFMGFIPDPVQLQETTAKRVAKRIREAEVDVTLLTAG